MEEESPLWVMVRLKNLKWHYCPKRLAYELIEENGPTDDVEMKPVNEGLIDLPGMIMTDRSYQNIRIDTFRLVIPTEDFEYFHDKLVDAPLRRFKGGDEYHKIHGWMACAVFTREQRDMIVEAMADALPEVREAAEAESVEFTRRLTVARGRGARVISGKESDLKGRN